MCNKFVEACVNVLMKINSNLQLFLDTTYELHILDPIRFAYLFHSHTITH